VRKLAFCRSSIGVLRHRSPLLVYLRRRDFSVG
jgi:hypothetical protein